MNPSPIHRYLFGSIVLALLCAGGTSEVRADNYSETVNSLNPVTYYRFNGNLDSSATGVNAVSAKLGAASAPSYGNGPDGASFLGLQSDNEAVTGITTNVTKLRLGDAATPVTAFNAAMNAASAVTYSMWFNLGSSPLASGASWYLLNGSGGAGNYDYLAINNSASNVTSFTLAGKSISTDAWQTKSYNYALLPDVWYNVVGVLDFANKKESIYVNGVLVGSASVTFANNYLTVTPGGFFSVGCNTSGGIANTSGLIDEAAVYNYALNGTQIANLYEASAVPEPATFALACIGGVAALARWKRLKSLQ